MRACERVCVCSRARVPFSLPVRHSSIELCGARAAEGGVAMFSHTARGRSEILFLANFELWSDVIKGSFLQKMVPAENPHSSGAFFVARCACWGAAAATFTFRF